MPGEGGVTPPSALDPRAGRGGGREGGGSVTACHRSRRGLSATGSMASAAQAAHTGKTARYTCAEQQVLRLRRAAPTICASGDIVRRRGQAPRTVLGGGSAYSAVNYASRSGRRGTGRKGKSQRGGVGE